MFKLHLLHDTRQPRSQEKKKRSYFQLLCKSTKLPNQTLHIVNFFLPSIGVHVSYNHNIFFEENKHFVQILGKTFSFLTRTLYLEISKTWEQGIAPWHSIGQRGGPHPIHCHVSASPCRPSSAEIVGGSTNNVPAFKMASE